MGLPVEWVFRGVSNTKIRIYRMANSLYQQYKNDKKNPDYVPGLEWEPYMMYIFPSGFEDLFHVVIESGEYAEGTYHIMSNKQLKDRFKITLKEKENEQNSKSNFGI